MSPSFATAVQMTLTLLVSVLLVTGCSKSTSDGQSSLVAVEPTISTI